MTKTECRARCPVVSRGVGALAMLIMLAAPGRPAMADTDEPTHAETPPIRLDLGPGGKIDTMAMAADGNLLVAISRPDPAAVPDPRPWPFNTTPRIHVLERVSPEGEVLATWPMKDVRPEMLHGHPDGTIYVGGHGRLGRLDAKGRLLASIDTDDIVGRPDAHISGVTANDRYFFVAFGDGFSLRATEDIVRFDLDLSNPKLIVTQQFGCCAHLDMDVHDDMLLVAENSRHRVNRFAFDGQLVDRWGKRDRTSVEGFAACCNPVNFDFGPDGLLYTAESGIGRIKRYTPDGKYRGMVGHVDTTRFDKGSFLAAQSCYIPMEVSKDGSRFFIMDVRESIIRVLAPIEQNERP